MIEITTFEYDGEYEVRLNIRVNSVDCSCNLIIYAEPHVFKKFGEELVDFPFMDKKNVIFEYGKDDSKWAYYCKLDISVYNASGKILMNVIMDNKNYQNNHYRCKFPVFTDIQTINKLGKELLKWIPFPGLVLSIDNEYNED